MKSTDIDNFNFAEWYYIRDIKDEMNRICTVDGVKKLTIAKISEYLLSEGVIREEEINGYRIKAPTERGKELGIQAIGRVSQAGNSYVVLQYPEVVQRMIANHFIGLNI